jgi:hypothetical protein
MAGITILCSEVKLSHEKSRRNKMGVLDELKNTIENYVTYGVETKIVKCAARVKWHGGR